MSQRRHTITLAMSLEPGYKLAHYEILEPIGKGGMGEVFRAKDGKLGRDVAIKVLPDELAGDEERVRRFRREANVLASLNHPGIAAIHGFEESEGAHFLVLELVPGETLAERIARGPMPVEEVLEMGIQIAEALENAHEHGIVHRDLKPANIKLTPDDKVKVLDFGLAKAFVEESADTDTSMSPTITRDATRAGVILGTASYMSPEQAKGKRVDARTDLFALGSVLFEMLAGARAFPGADVSEVLAAVIKLEPEWTALPRDLPPRLTELLRRALTKDVRKRLQHVGDARILMEEASSEDAAPTKDGDSHPQGRTNPFVVAALAASLAAGLTWLSVPSPETGPRLVTRTVIPLAPGTELALGGRPTLAISHDGRSIAFAQRSDTESALYLRELDDLEATPIEGTEGGLTPFFSPDGDWLAFRSDAAIQKVSLSGGAPVIVAENLAFRGNGDWSADGSIVLSARAESGLVRVSDDGGEPEALTRVDSERGDKTHRLVDLLPDGNAILFMIGNSEIDSFDDAAIAVHDLESGESRVLIEGGTSPRYSPSGHLVYARNGSLLAVAFDADSLRVTGAPVTVLEGVSTSPNYGHAEFDISRTGTLVYAPGGPWGNDNGLVWVDREGSVTPLAAEPRAYMETRISPDGRALALTLEGANASIWIHDLSRGIQTPLAVGNNNVVPIWAARADRVTFRKMSPAGWEFRSRSADGSDDPDTLFSSDAAATPGSWTSDGTTLLFDERGLDSGADILTLSLGPDPVVSEVIKTAANESHPMISPDDRWLAFQSDESGQWESYVQAFPEAPRKFRVSTGGGTLPRWNPNGRELFYRNGDALMVVEVKTRGGLDLGTPKFLFERASPYSRYDVAPDGERFIMVDTSVARAAPTELILIQNWSEELKRLVPTQ